MSGGPNVASVAFRLKLVRAVAELAPVSHLPLRSGDILVLMMLAAQVGVDLACDQFEEMLDRQVGAQNIQQGELHE